MLCGGARKTYFAVDGFGKKDRVGVDGGVALVHEGDDALLLSVPPLRYAPVFSGVRSVR